MTETTTILVTGIKRESPKAILACVEGLEVWLPKSQITKLAFKGKGTLYRIPYWLAGKKGLKGENTADALEGASFTPESEPVEDEADYLGPSESERVVGPSLKPFATYEELVDWAGDEAPIEEVDTGLYRVWESEESREAWHETSGHSYKPTYARVTASRKSTKKLTLTELAASL